MSRTNGMVSFYFLRVFPCREVDTVRVTKKRGPARNIGYLNDGDSRAERRPPFFVTLSSGKKAKNKTVLNRIKERFFLLTNPTYKFRNYIKRR